MRARFWVEAGQRGRGLEARHDPRVRFEIRRDLGRGPRPSIVIGLVERHDVAAFRRLRGPWRVLLAAHGEPWWPYVADEAAVKNERARRFTVPKFLAESPPSGAWTPPPSPSG
jgi:hypothetical protein